MRRALAIAALLGLADLSAPAFAQENAALEARLAAYKARVGLLEDEDAIENLQALYGYYFDKGLWDEVASLFAKEGSFEYGQRGVYIGPERIRRALLLFGPEGLGHGYLNTHMQLQSIITVAPDGLTATARWQGMIMLSEPGANGVWGIGQYENAYVKERGVWKLSKLHFYVQAEGDYDLGFGRGPLRMEGLSALFPPDRPPTEVYRAFPQGYTPPFSFVHPVTGEPMPVTQPADTVARPQP